MTTSCQVDGCDREIHCRDLCKMHYSRWYRHGDPLFTKNMSRAGVCGVQDCTEAINSRGMCTIHYDRMRARGDTGLAERERRPRQQRCGLQGCREPHVAQGYCERHYDSWRKYGDPLEVARRRQLEQQVCSVEGCSRASGSKGLKERPGDLKRVCGLHRQRWATHGSFDLPEKPAPEWSAGYINAEGYRILSRDNVRRQAHRVVMEQAIGRELLPNENVHHINGDRLDNRLDNLELWVISQPCGQRAVDLVSWARQLIENYGDLVDSGVVT